MVKTKITLIDQCFKHRNKCSQEISQVPEMQKVSYARNAEGSVNNIIKIKHEILKNKITYR